MASETELRTITEQLCDEIMIIPGVTSFDVIKNPQTNQFYIRIGVTTYHVFRKIKEIMENRSIPKNIWQIEWDK